MPTNVRNAQVLGVAKIVHQILRSSDLSRFFGIFVQTVENCYQWEDFRRDAAKGYEFASHSITHASMPGLDSVNIAYELEKSKEEMKEMKTLLLSLK